MPYNSLDRTARGQLQRQAGDAGVVLERVVQTTRERRYIGWYWRPARAKPGCSCDHCAAAAALAAAYLGYHVRDGILELGRYGEQHPELVPA